MHRSSTSSQLGSHGLDLRSSALLQVEGWKTTGYLRVARNTAKNGSFMLFSTTFIIRAQNILKNIYFCVLRKESHAGL